jgi:hypothetical protein
VAYRERHATVGSGHAAIGQSLEGRHQDRVDVPERAGTSRRRVRSAQMKPIATVAASAPANTCRGRLIFPADFTKQL